MILETARIRLRCWQDEDRRAFAAMHANPQVMLDLGGPISRTRADAKLDRYAAAYDRWTFCRWAVDSLDGRFLGYTGVMPVLGVHPLGAHHEIGWRFRRAAWGQGYATEAAGAALQDVFTRVGLGKVIAYTAPDNLRSQAVMRRLRLLREPERDFTAHYDGVDEWTGWVWAARPS